MGMLFTQTVEGTDLCRCRFCNMLLASLTDTLSKEFQGRYGRGYLVDKVVNITLGVPETRNLLTGCHVVRDFYCCSCRNILGWTYDTAFVDSEKYKEGKFMLEMSRIYCAP